MDISKYRTDRLLLLVGKNPLPNAISGKLLVRSGGQIILIHSPDTAPLAMKLEKYFTGVQTSRAEIDETNASSIYEAVFDKALKDSAGCAIGLHYTGGTKAMAVHAYGAVRRWSEENKQGQPPVFSYLDARTLALVVDPNDPRSGNGMSFPISTEVKIGLTDLIDLHGWSYQRYKDDRPMKPSGSPKLPKTAMALASLYSAEDGPEVWRDWKRKELRPQCHSGKKWDQKRIQQASLSLSTDSRLSGVNEALARELSLTGVTLPVAAYEQKVGLDGQELCEWLDGKWLEHYILHCLLELNRSPMNLGLHDGSVGVKINEVDFEIDVLAVRGYQLFAFSCSTDTAESDDRLKLKLFEAYVRSRQLGGDEARMALVCPVEDTDRLEEQMLRDIESDRRIRVFGSRDLVSIDATKAAIKQWIEEQNR